MADLRARYERYAQQINRLVARKGKKWKRVECVRRKQRRCMLSMLLFPPAQLSRALRRVQPVVDMSKEALLEYEGGESTSQIYVHVHPSVRSAY